ncbi:hypothetical protein IJE86_08135 [bacterium]|nr:hypothetical protein [bacterium]
MANYQVGNLELRIISYAKTATTGLTKMNNQLSKTQKTLKNVGITASLGKWNYMINMARYYGRSLANIVQLSMDYVETQNLWQVANRNNLDIADQFIEKMNKAYGVSEATLMNYQAIFKNMLSALGDLSDEISSGLSMQLTQMALDFSSLYNVTIPQAMQKFQAVLSGQVRPIRSISGYDITENTIFDLYAGAGGEKTMRQLSQIEKRLLRIVAVFDQMGATGATGDMAKTIESASNQARIMSEQAKETLTWTGQLVLMWLRNAGVLQKVNAFLMTTKEIIKSIVKSSANYVEDDFLKGLVTTSEDASEAIDEIQGKLLSFDRFEALNSAESNVLGIDSTVLGLLENINYEMEEFKMEAQTLSEEWLSALGYVYDAEKGIYVATEQTEKWYSVLKLVGGILAVISAYSIGNKLFGGLGVKVGGIKSSISDIKALLALSKETSTSLTAVAQGVGGISSGVLGLSKAIQFFTSPLGIILSVLGILYFTNEDFRESINELFDSLKPLLDLLLGLIADILKPLMPLITGVINLVGTGLSYVIKVFNISLSGAILTLIPFAYALEFVLKVLQSIIQALADIATFNWSNFGKNQSAIWSNWKSTEFAKSSWSNFKGSFSAFADGGFPREGQLFIAREAGAEMVGSMGGRTAVANNDQIVTGITQGVYSAMMAYNAQTRGQGGSGDVYLDGTKVGRVVAKSSHGEMVRTGLLRANS